MPSSGSWKYSARRASAKEEEEEEEEELRRYRSQTRRALPVGGVGLRASLPAEVRRSRPAALSQKSSTSRRNRRTIASGCRRPAAPVRRTCSRSVRARPSRRRSASRRTCRELLSSTLCQPFRSQSWPDQWSSKRRRDLEPRLVVGRELAHPAARVVPVVLREEDLVADVARLDAEPRRGRRGRRSGCTRRRPGRRTATLFGWSSPRGRRPSRSPRRRRRGSPTGFGSSETSRAARFRPNWFAFCAVVPVPGSKLVVVGRPVRVPRGVASTRPCS